MLEGMKNHIFRYKDAHKQFMFNIFQRITYLKGIDVALFHKIMYSFKELIVQKDEILLKEGDPVNYMIVLKHGELELFNDIDSTIMVIERLGPGSVLNYRNFYFDEETMSVNVRCSARSVVMLLSIKRLNELISEDENLDKKFMLHMNSIYKKDQRFPIDCIWFNCKSELNQRQHARLLTLKSVVLQVISHNRQEKKKPTLYQIMAHFRRKGIRMEKLSEYQRKQLQ